MSKRPNSEVLRTLGFKFASRSARIHNTPQRELRPRTRLARRAISLLRDGVGMKGRSCSDGNATEKADGSTNWEIRNNQL